ncbi:acyl-CoA dehydrogenase family protein [Hoeflea alexandrii]|uniref:acyl-CoA dehydrogenase family protein n=1 Tax=Hoeflea alexandrii TaxID=288436 RepID=UPI0022AE6C5B|nr:acyl-CoA dehydrogenase family protein [Hoeflea alexandrii]MCZ4287540.1 acyl-CoA/acyl-ACP dehydrogenase [Hoeflea alexandrii]
MPEIILEDPDGTFAMLRDSVAAFAQRFDGARALRARRGAGKDIDRDIWSAMAEAGWLGLMLPEDLGGAGLGLSEQAILSEALGRALITEPLAQLSVFSGALLAGAEPGEERSRLAEGLISGSLVVSPVWQTTDGGYAAVSATENETGVTLSGTAGLVVAAVSADVLLVLARSGDDRMLVSVAAGSEGITVMERPTVDGATLAELRFDGCHVAADQILARNLLGSGLLDEAIQAARLTLAAELAGAGSKALEATVDYTKERVQFGKPIASFQAIQHRLVDMWSAAEFSCAAIVNALERLADEPGKPAALAVLAAKARAGDAAIDITRKAIHLHGAMGFTDECDIGLYMKRAVNLNATLGNPAQLRLQFVALERAA